MIKAQLLKGRVPIQETCLATQLTLFVLDINVLRLLSFELFHQLTCNIIQEGQHT
jgi:hypothetical protein